MRIRIALFFALVFATVPLASCQTSGGAQSINDFGRFQQLQAGQTTKTQLFSIFGQPHDVEFGDGGQSTWRYYWVVQRMSGRSWIPYANLAIGGNNLNITRAAFFFDGDGKFARSERSENNRFQSQYASTTQTATRARLDRIQAEMQSIGQPFDRAQALRVTEWMSTIQK